jgi:membrane protease YdiL (CAAX protease family)
MLMLMVAIALSASNRWSELAEDAAGLILTFAGVAAYWWCYAWWRNIPVRAVMGSWPSRKRVGVSLLAMVGSVGLGFGLSSLLHALGWFDPVGGAEGGSSAQVAFVVMAILVGPPVEEVLFRGVVLSRLAPRVGVWPSVLLSSAMFAALHSNVALSFAFAWVMAAVRFYTRSLWVPALAHCLHNALLIPLVLVGAFEWALSEVWIGAGLVVLCLPWLGLFVYRELRAAQAAGFGSVRGAV